MPEHSNKAHVCNDNKISVLWNTVKGLIAWVDDIIQNFVDNMSPFFA